nr:EOG090X0KZ2 [Chydorus sphaericus]
MDATTAGDLESEALKRKKRIEALRQLKEQKQQDGKEPSQPLPGPLFRSYKPADEGLQKASLPVAQPEAVDEQVAQELSSAAQAPALEEIDLLNLAPRKPDWDLKRDVAKKLAKLEKRTQRAIAVLIRERLMETKQGDVDLVKAVNALN